MSGDHSSPEAIKAECRKYIKVGILLIIATVITVAIAQVDLDAATGIPHLNIIVGLLVAIVKASLVALIFMHLISEKQLIYWTLGFTMLFFAVLLYGPIFGQDNGIESHKYWEHTGSENYQIHYVEANELAKAAALEAAAAHGKGHGEDHHEDDHHDNHSH